MIVLFTVVFSDGRLGKCLVIGSFLYCFVRIDGLSLGEVREWAPNSAEEFVSVNDS